LHFSGACLIWGHLGIGDHFTAVLGASLTAAAIAGRIKLRCDRRAAPPPELSYAFRAGAFDKGNLMIAKVQDIITGR